jgi:hypothetical protein
LRAVHMCNCTMIMPERKETKERWGDYLQWHLQSHLSSWMVPCLAMESLNTCNMVSEHGPTYTKICEAESVSPSSQ